MLDSVFDLERVLKDDFVVDLDIESLRVVVADSVLGREHDKDAEKEIEEAE